MDGSKSARVRMVRREGVQRWEGGMVASPSLRTIPPLRALLYWQGRIRGVLLGRGPCRREAPGMKNEYKQLLSHLMPNSAFSKAMELYLKLFVCSSVCPSRIGTYPLSPLYDFQTIQTICFLWGYDPGNMSLSSSKAIPSFGVSHCCTKSINLFKSSRNNKKCKSKQNVEEAPILPEPKILNLGGSRPYQNWHGR